MNNVVHGGWSDRPRAAEHNGGNGGNDGGPPMEVIERITRVEEKVGGLDKRLELVETDLRSLIGKVDSHFLVLGGMIIAAVLGLAGMMAKGFGWL